MDAVELNLDAHNKARSLHRVIRAMHDGECPKRHAIHPADAMRYQIRNNSLCGYSSLPVYVQEESGWRCPDCGFKITDAEAHDALATFAPFMERNLAVFEEWRAGRSAEVQP